MVALVIGLSGCQPAAETNANLTATTSPTPTKATFDPAAIEAEVLKLEREWVDAVKSHNAEPVKRILADDIVIVYPDGTKATKAEEVSSTESGAITADTFEMIDPKVTVLDADSAFITGRSVVKNGKYKAPNQKGAINISGEYRFLDVYAKRDGKWVAVASQATRIDPSIVAAAAASPSVSPSPAAASPTP